MEEKALVVFGAAAAVAIANRGLRPMAKLAVKGYVAVTEATADARRELAELRAEAREEYHAGRGRSTEPSGATSRPGPTAR